MKKLLLSLCLLPWAVFAQAPVPAPATAADVSAGTATYKFITPKSAADAGLTTVENAINIAAASNLSYRISATNNTAGNAATSTATTNLVGKAFVIHDGVVSGGYETIADAIDAAVAGDTVWVTPGIYAENDLAKDGINLKGDIGADIIYVQTTTNDAGMGIIDDRGKGPIRMQFDWPGRMIMITFTNILLTDTNDYFPIDFNPNTIAVLSHTNPSSQFLGHIGELAGGNYQQATLFLWNAQYGSNSVLKIDKMYDVFDGQYLDRLLYAAPGFEENFIYSAVQGWFVGASYDYFTLHCPYLKATGFYAWYWLEPVENTRTNDMYFYAGYTKGTIYGTSSNTFYRGWMTGGTLHQGVISCYGGGKWYFDIQKIEAGGGTAFATAKAYNNNISNGVNYVRSMKIESSVKFINVASSTSYFSVDDFNAIGDIENGITSTANGRVIPHYSVSGLTNISAAETSLLINIVPPMPGTNYTPLISFGFNPVAVHWVSDLNRSNFTLNFSAGVTTGGAVRWETKQNTQ